MLSQAAWAVTAKADLNHMRRSSTVSYFYRSFDFSLLLVI